MVSWETPTTPSIWTDRNYTPVLAYGDNFSLVRAYTELDCSLAFNKCKFWHLLNPLLDKGLPKVVIRVIAFIYMVQYGWVKWRRSISRQGAILTPMFWAVYSDPMQRPLWSCSWSVHGGSLLWSCAPTYSSYLECNAKNYYGTRGLCCWLQYPLQHRFNTI